MGITEILVSHLLKKSYRSWELVVHAYNLSYLGGRDQEDRSSKPAWASSSQDPISKKKSQKRAGGIAQGTGPKFKPQY
jgi:hypothetical protein